MVITPACPAQTRWHSPESYYSQSSQQLWSLLRIVFTQIATRSFELGAQMSASNIFPPSAAPSSRFLGKDSVKLSERKKESQSDPKGQDMREQRHLYFAFLSCFVIAPCPKTTQFNVSNPIYTPLFLEGE